MGNLCAETGDPGKALVLLQQAFSHYEELAEAHPHRHRPELAGSAYNISLALSELDEDEDAFAWSERAVRTIAPLLLELPEVYAAWADAMLDHYRMLAVEIDGSPDAELVELIEPNRDR